MPSRRRPRRPFPGPAIFQREGEYWTIAYDGVAVRLRDNKGLQYIAYLLGRPGRDVSVGDLRTTARPLRWQDEGSDLVNAVDSAERLRKAVTNRIRGTLTKIRAEHEPLGLHLANSIRTGRLCSYTPERPTTWTL
jgi:hypothetical protein